MTRTKKLPLATRLTAACTLVVGLAGVLWSLGSDGVVAVGAAGGSELTVTPSSGLTDGTVVSVVGSGLDVTQNVRASECSDAAGQPTVVVGAVSFPVSCGVPIDLTGDQQHPLDVVAAPLVISVGTAGPPIGGIDSDGTSAAADAVGFPCPPTAAEIAAGAECAIVAGDISGVVASAPISFASAGRRCLTPRSPRRPTLEQPGDANDRRHADHGRDPGDHDIDDDTDDDTAYDIAYDIDHRGRVDAAYIAVLGPKPQRSGAVRTSSLRRRPDSMVGRSSR